MIIPITYMSWLHDLYADCVDQGWGQSLNLELTSIPIPILELELELQAMELELEIAKMELKRKFSEDFPPWYILGTLYFAPWGIFLLFILVHVNTPVYACPYPMYLCIMNKL